MKFTVSLVTAMSICAFASVVNASNVADGDIVTFTANTAAKASEVNGNFTALKNAVNDNDTRITTNTNSVATINSALTTNTNSVATINSALAGATFFYGDGSAGDLTISATIDWASTPPTNYNLNFGNVTIGAGQTLTVPAGTTIRCNGNFTNNGTISVSSGVQTSGITNWGSGSTAEMFAIGHPGDSLAPASSGGFHNNGAAAPATQYFGLGGVGIPQLMAASRFHAFRFGGGSGAGYRNGGVGGGLFNVYCKGAVSNTGVISSNGTNGGLIAGGGGGGIVVLASTTSVTIAGTVNANGGTGSASYGGGSGAGGGGGGGIVILAAPTVDTTAATITVTGGSPGSLALASYSGAARIGGGGGGASGGNGGNGGTISGAATGVFGAGTSGTNGYTLTLQQNPLYLMN